MKTIKSVFSCFFILVMLTGCFSAKESVSRQKIDSGIDLPKKFQTTHQSTSISYDKWWKAFGNSELNELMDKMFESNHQLAVSFEGLKALQYKHGITKSDRLPSVDAKAGVSEKYMTDTRGDRGWNEGYELSLTASYEADIWGRVKSRTEAGRYEIQAGKYDLETLYISLSAEMAERYYLYQYLIKQREYLKGQLKLKTDQLEARERMYEYGIGSVETVYNSRKAISDIQDSINENEKNIKDAKLEIAKLLGHSSSSGINLKSSPLTVPELPKAIPSDVVKNRPDIQSAFSTVMKIDRNAAEAVANRYPKLSLSASAAYNGDEIRNLITPDNFVANILANLVMPVFDANSRKLEAERQKTLLAQQIYRYQDTVIGALKEVESALLENIQKEKALINSNEKKEIDKKLLAVSKMRYELGVKKYENVIDSQVDKISGEIAFIKARRDLISSRIGLIRAIGGSWASDNITERLASKENGE